MSIESSYCSILLFTLHHMMIVKHEIGACKVLFNQENSSDFLFYLNDENSTDGVCLFFRVYTRNHTKEEEKRKFNCKLFDSIRTSSFYAFSLRIKSKKNNSISISTAYQFSRSLIDYVIDRILYFRQFELQTNKSYTSIFIASTFIIQGVSATLLDEQYICI